jgi:hypothetical protein
VFSQSTFHKHFSTELPFLKFCRNLILLSVFSLLPFLIVFVALTPEFAKMLMTNTAALGRFSRQVVTNGLPAVFVVNYVGFVATSRFCEKANVSARNHILLDGSVRGGVFVGLHVLYMSFQQTFMVHLAVTAGLHFASWVRRLSGPICSKTSRASTFMHFFQEPTLRICRFG